ncbi:hypothetical protein ACHWQZ_G013862 [Mnemiopsis leidyi]
MEGTDVTLPAPEILPPPPTEADSNDTTTGVQDVPSETVQAQKHRNFVSKCNEDAFVKFGNTMSADESVSDIGLSAPNSELLFPASGDQEFSLAEAENIAETMVGLIIDQAISLVSEENEEQLDQSQKGSACDIADDLISQNCQTIDENGEGNDKNEDVTQSDSEKDETKRETEEKPTTLDDDNNFQIYDLNDHEIEHKISGASLQSENLTRNEDTFSFDKCNDPSEILDDMLSNDQLEYTDENEMSNNIPETLVDEDFETPKVSQPSTKVTIDVMNSLYFPTKLVTGCVSISREYDITSLTLSLICEGNQSITWINGTSAENSDESIANNSEKIVENQSFFTDYVDLVYRESDADEKLNYTFSYQFPPNLPSSFSYVQNDEKSLCALVEYSFILLDIKENQIIAKKTINLYEAPPYHYLTQSKKDSLKMFYLTCIHKGTVTLKAELDKGCYFLGDVAQIRCCVENEASEKISEIGVYLCRYLHFRDAKFNQCQMRHIVNRQKFQDLDGKWSSQSHKAVIPFEIKEFGTQTVSSSQFINCYYIIRVAIKTKSGYDLFVDLDVVLYNPNQNLSEAIKDGYDLYRKPSSSYDRFSGNTVNSSSTSTNSSRKSVDGLSEKDASSVLKVAQKIKKIVDSDQYSSVGKSFKSDEEFEDRPAILLSDEGLRKTENKDASEQSLTHVQDQGVEHSKPDFEEDKLTVELPRFPEDYLPTSGDELDASSMQEADIIVQL